MGKHPTTYLWQRQALLLQREGDSEEMLLHKPVFQGFFRPCYFSFYNAVSQLSIVSDNVYGGDAYVLICLPV